MNNNDNQTQSTFIDRVKKRSVGLKRGMSTSSAIMLGVGSTIGTGLFLGSGDVLSKAGPGGAIIMYLIGGLTIWLAMMCMGELASAMPVGGSLQAFTSECCGNALGCTVGWVTWIATAMTITAQIVASSIITRDMLPNTPVWLWIVIYTIIILGVNLLDAKHYGAVSFWVSTLKLLLIAGIIIAGVAIIFGIGKLEPVGTSNLTGKGGLFPTGIAGMAAVFLSALYAYSGGDNVATTAGELNDEKKMPKVMNGAIVILILATIVSIALIATIMPWNEASVLGSPFVYALKNVGLNGAALIVNIIVLSSALTSGNYFVFISSRYLWSMAKFKQAPKFIAKTDKRGVPYTSILVTMLFAVLGILAQFFAEDTVYLFIIWLIGGCNIFIYIMEFVTLIMFRKKYKAEGGKIEDLKYKVISFPLVPILGIVIFTLVFIVSIITPEQRLSIIISAICYVLIYLGAFFYTKKHKDVKIPEINGDIDTKKE